MHNPHDPQVLPMREGVNPSCVVLPSQNWGWGGVFDFLVQRLPAVDRADWLQRMEAGEVLDEWGQRITPLSPFVAGLRIYYYRAVGSEPAIPFEASILYQDEHLLVADKPHFLPVVPSGAYLQETLLVRLKRQLGLRELSPLHRIDRDTAGLVLFCVQRATRGRYQALFRERCIHKVYEAIAPWRPELGLSFPRQHQSRLQESTPFFRMHEVAGSPNSCTQIDLLDVAAPWARYRLAPISGKRHQLRVHMAALGLPLWGDTFYPTLRERPVQDYRQPLQLLARELAFTDPLSGQERRFCSQRHLLALSAVPALDV